MPILPPTEQDGKDRKMLIEIINVLMDTIQKKFPETAADGVMIVLGRKKIEDKTYNNHDTEGSTCKRDVIKVTARWSSELQWCDAARMLAVAGKVVTDSYHSNDPDKI